MAISESCRQQQPITNRFDSWALWGLLGCVILITTILPFLGLVGAILLMVIWPIAGISALIGLARAIKGSLLRRATSMGLLVVFICWPFFGKNSFVTSIGRASNIVHLFFEKSHFEEKYHGALPAEEPVWALDWSIFVTSNTFVIYDASGRIALPKSHGAWKNEEMAPFQVCADSVTPIYGNYYRCDE